MNINNMNHISKNITNNNNNNNNNNNGRPKATGGGGLGGGPAGEAEFSVDEDRKTLGPVVKGALHRKLWKLLEAQDFVNYRLLLNLQSFYLRGLPVDAEHEIIPGFEANRRPGSPSLVVQKFLYQNGFLSATEMDSNGWAPVHYAALHGDAAIMHGLLELRADPNCNTEKDQKRVGAPPGIPALNLCLFFNNNDAARQLIFARAEVSYEGTVAVPLHVAVEADNVEGIRMLLEAGCDVHVTNVFGNHGTAVTQALMCGSVVALKEILRAGFRVDFSKSGGLNYAMFLRGGSAEMVCKLVNLRADVNQVFDAWGDSTLLGILTSAASFAYRCGSVTSFSKFGYHSQGATPLMFAIITAQYSGAAALVAEGADLSCRNARGYSVADLAREFPVPDFLMRALEGDPTECKRLYQLESRGSLVGM